MDIITNWFTDDGLSHEAEDNFGQCDVYQPQANYRQSSPLPRNSSDSFKNSDKSKYPDAFISLSGILTILETEKPCGKAIQIQLWEAHLLALYLLVQAVPRQVSQFIIKAFGFQKYRDDELFKLVGNRCIEGTVLFFKSISSMVG